MPSRKETERVLCPNQCGSLIMPRGLKSHLQSCKKGEYTGMRLLTKVSRYIQAFFILMYWLRAYSLLPIFLLEPL